MLIYRRLRVRSSSPPNTSRLIHEYQRLFVSNLIAQEQQEKGPAPDLAWNSQNAQLQQLEGRLDTTYRESALPGESDCGAVNNFLIRWRSGESGSG
jgi:hypothetical protein